MNNVKYLFLILFLVSAFTRAQMYNPVKWSTSAEKVSETEYDLLITADIENGWHLYSLDVPDNGPIPTSIQWEENKDRFRLVGGPKEGKGHVEFDNVFEMTIKYFEKEAVFRQRIEKITGEELIIKGVLEFMVCDDTSCLPPTEVDLLFDLKTAMIPTGTVEADPESVYLLPDSVITTETEAQVSDAVTQPKADHSVSLKKQKSKGLWTLFILSFFAGFAALLTPCVFPMIPMTVSFFTKQSKNKAIGIRNAVIYGLSIVFLYVLLGTVVT